MSPCLQCRCIIATNYFQQQATLSRRKVHKSICTLRFRKLKKVMCYAKIEHMMDTMVIKLRNFAIICHSTLPVMRSFVPRMHLRYAQIEVVGCPFLLNGFINFCLALRFFRLTLKNYITNFDLEVHYIA